MVKVAILHLYDFLFMTTKLRSVCLLKKKEAKTLIFIWAKR